jgi:hypothetical protein
MHSIRDGYFYIFLDGAEFVLRRPTISINTKRALSSGSDPLNLLLSVTPANDTSSMFPSVANSPTYVLPWNVIATERLGVIARNLCERVGSLLTA